MSRAVMQQALEALEGLADYRYTDRVKNTMASLRQALAEPEQETKQVAWNWMQDGQPYSPAYYGPPPDDDVVRIGLANGRSVRLLYTAPTPQREHITDGSPCWCNPDAIEEEGGNVIIHNYEDNWQQYAKPGETAQQCIERHRAEQDALMKLYATPSKPEQEIGQALKRAVERINELEAELAEQARVNGMGSEREARLMALNAELVEALRCADAMLSGANMDAKAIKRKVSAALAKVEASK